jgi:amino-acid N-acetyltransferase
MLTSAASAVPETSVTIPATASASGQADHLSQRFVAWVRAAAPYIHAFRGKTFVLGFGGEVAAGELAQTLAYDCNLLAALGVRLVLVHGARPQIEAELGPPWPERRAITRGCG